MLVTAHDPALDTALRFPQLLLVFWFCSRIPFRDHILFGFHVCMGSSGLWQFPMLLAFYDSCRMPLFWNVQVP